MAKQKTTYDPGIEYQVKFRRPYPLGSRRTCQPLHTYYFRGEALEAIPAEFVLSAVAMPPMPEIAG